MSKSLNRQEQLLKDRINRIALVQLEKLYGIEVNLFRSAKDEYSRVYGVESGEHTQESKKITVLICADTFAPMDRFNAGLLQEGWLYSTKPDVVTVGDLVEVQREDGRAYKFKITYRESLGMSESVIVRYKIAAHGEDNVK